jgi:hypothetical protein
MTTNLKLKRPEEMYFVFGSLVQMMPIGYDADDYPLQRYRSRTEGSICTCWLIYTPGHDAKAMAGPS